MEHKKLYLSNFDKKIAGVCGGLGEFFGIDSTLIRIVFLVVFFLGGSGLVVYIICWAIVPRSINLTQGSHGMHGGRHSGS